jgi:hypothetical protein
MRCSGRHSLCAFPTQFISSHSFLEQFTVGPLAPVLRVAGMGYEAASADDAWRRIHAFFEEHLAAGESREAGLPTRAPLRQVLAFREGHPLLVRIKRPVQ